MRTRHKILLTLALGLCFGGTALADSVNLTFDEAGNISFTDTTTVDNITTTTPITGITTNTSGSGFDSMGSTLQYILPSNYTFPLNFSGTQGRSEIILTTGNPATVDDVIILLGSTIDVYSSWAGSTLGGSRSATLDAEQYYTTTGNGPAAVIPESTVANLENDLIYQNKSNSVWFSQGAMVISEQAPLPGPTPPPNAYTYTTTGAEAGFIQNSNTGTITAATITFVDGDSAPNGATHDIPVSPVPASATTGGVLLGLLALGKYLHRSKKPSAA